jgi:DNA-binding MarR family transcriptional regulator
MMQDSTPMPPENRDVEAMVAALFTLVAKLDRARHERRAASELALLQVIAAGGAVRPSEIAAGQHVHQSLVTRQIRELEDAGLVTVAGNPADGRSYLVSLTPAGIDELQRLTSIGLRRFATFVSDWDPEQVQLLTHLLEKLQTSMASVGANERPLSASERRATRRSVGAPREKEE